MIVLCTAEPVLEFDGDRLRLRVPSGDDVVEIAMTRNQARMLVERGKRHLDAQDAVEMVNRGAEIIKLRKARKRQTRSKAKG